MKTPTAPLYWLKVTDIAKGNYKISTLPSKIIELKTLKLHIAFFNKN